MGCLVGCHPYLEKESKPSAKRFVHTFRPLVLPLQIHSDSSRVTGKIKPIDSVSVLAFICQSANFNCLFWSFESYHLPNQPLKYYPLGRFRMSEDIEALIYQAETSNGLSFTALGCFSRKENKIISKIVLSEKVGEIPESNHSSWAIVDTNFRVEYTKLVKWIHLNNAGLMWFPCLKHSSRTYWSIQKQTTIAQLLPSGKISVSCQSKFYEAREEKGGKLVYPVDPCNDR